MIQLASVFRVMCSGCKSFQNTSLPSLLKEASDSQLRLSPRCFSASSVLSGDHSNSRRRFARPHIRDPLACHRSPILKPSLEQQKDPDPIRPSEAKERSFLRTDGPTGNYGLKPRPPLKYYPHKWEPRGGFPAEYTTKPLETYRTGGRHPRTGRVMYRRTGGGVRPQWRMLDVKRSYIPDDRVIEEKVYEVRENPNLTSGHLALIGHEDSARWVIATDTVKAGQIVKSSRAVERMSVRAFPGDTYAVGALPIGTVISLVEAREGSGQKFARAAGCCASILKKNEDSVVIQLPSKQTIQVSNKCIATVGRISNPGWKDIDWGSAGANRRRGIRPHTGLWHRKDGYCGRKIHPPKPLRSYLTPAKSKPEPYLLT